MEIWQKNHIAENLDKLITVTCLTNELFEELEDVGILTQQEHDRIEAFKDNLTGIKTLYEIMQTKSAAYKKLILALQCADQDVAADILEQAIVARIQPPPVPVLSMHFKDFPFDDEDDTSSLTGGEKLIQDSTSERMETSLKDRSIEGHAFLPTVTKNGTQYLTKEVIQKLIEDHSKEIFEISKGSLCVEKETEISNGQNKKRHLNEFEEDYLNLRETNEWAQIYFRNVVKQIPDINKSKTGYHLLATIFKNEIRLLKSDFTFQCKNILKEVTTPVRLIEYLLQQEVLIYCKQEYGLVESDMTRLNKYQKHMVDDVMSNLQWSLFPIALSSKIEKSKLEKLNLFCKQGRDTGSINLAKFPNLISIDENNGNMYKLPKIFEDYFVTKFILTIASKENDSSDVMVQLAADRFICILVHSTVEYKEQLLDPFSCLELMNLMLSIENLSSNFLITLCHSLLEYGDGDPIRDFILTYFRTASSPDDSSSEDDSEDYETAADDDEEELEEYTIGVTPHILIILALAMRTIHEAKKELEFKERLRKFLLPLSQQLANNEKFQKEWLPKTGYDTSQLNMCSTEIQVN